MAKSDAEIKVRVEGRVTTPDVQIRQVPIENMDGAFLRVPDQMEMVCRVDARKSTFDDEKRTITNVVLSTDAEVRRWFGIEILIHKPDAVDMTRIADDGPILLEHFRFDHVGVIERATLREDGALEIDQRFARTAKADDAWQEVAVDRIKTKMSVGYRILKVRREAAPTDDDGNPIGPPTYYVTRWQPLEGSWVAMAADNRTGPNRGGQSGLMPDDKPDWDGFVVNEQGERFMADETITTRSDAGGTDPAPEVVERSTDTHPPDVETDSRHEDAIKAERDNTAQILEIAEMMEQRIPNAGKLARDCIAKGKSASYFTSALRKEVQESNAILPGDPRIGMDEREIKRFDLGKAIRSMADPTNIALRKEADFEFSISGEIAKSHPRDIKGILIPPDVLMAPQHMLSDSDHRGAMQIPQYARGSGWRPMGGGVPQFPMGQRTDWNVTTDNKGGYLKPTDISASILDMLHAKMVVPTMGATVLTGLQGDFGLPRLTTGADVGWVNETAKAEDASAIFALFTAQPHTVACVVDLSRKILKQTNAVIQAFAQNHMTTRLAVEADRAMIANDTSGGTAEAPLGIEYTTGIGAVDFVAEAPTWAEVVAVMAEVGVDNALVGNLWYASHMTLMKVLMTTAKESGYPVYILGDNGQIGPWPFMMSNQVEDLYDNAGTPAQKDTLLAGNFADYWVFEWGTIELIVDPYTLSSAGGLRLVALYDVDGTPGHPESFAEGHMATV